MCYYFGMTTTMSIRVDEKARHEIDELTAPGKSRNAAILDAVHEAYRQSVYERMRLESAALRDDPEYQEEIRAIREDMGAGDAW